MLLIPKPCVIRSDGNVHTISPLTLVAAIATRSSQVDEQDDGRQRQRGVITS